MKKFSRGFTLIELMIVLAVIGILAALAVPSYQDYLTRARVTEGIQIAASAKVAVAEYYQVNGDFPSNNGEAGLLDNINSPYVSRVEVGSNGVITITYNAASGVGSNNVLQFSPAVGNGAIVWSCKDNATTVSSQYLPANCR